MFIAAAEGIGAPHELHHQRRAATSATHNVKSFSQICACLGGFPECIGYPECTHRWVDVVVEDILGGASSAVRSLLGQALQNARVPVPNNGQWGLSGPL